MKTTLREQGSRGLSSRDNLWDMKIKSNASCVFRRSVCRRWNQRYRLMRWGRQAKKCTARGNNQSNGRGCSQPCRNRKVEAGNSVQSSATLILKWQQARGNPTGYPRITGLLMHPRSGLPTPPGSSCRSDPIAAKNPPSSLHAMRRVKLTRQFYRGHNIVINPCGKCDTRNIEC